LKRFRVQKFKGSKNLGVGVNIGFSVGFQKTEVDECGIRNGEWGMGKENG